VFGFVFLVWFVAWCVVFGRPRCPRALLVRRGCRRWALVGRPLWFVRRWCRLVPVWFVFVVRCCVLGRGCPRRGARSWSGPLPVPFGWWPCPGFGR